MSKTQIQFWLRCRAALLVALAVPMLAPAQTSKPVISAITNVASYATGPVAPGEMVILFGSGLGPASLVTLQLDAEGKVANKLADVQVLFDGTPSPLIYVSATQVAAMVPYASAGKTTVQVQAVYLGTASDAYAATIAATAPGIFSADQSGKGQGAINNPGWSLNSAANPVAPGSYFTFYMTGYGQTDPAGSDGEVAKATANVKAPVAVTIAGRDAKVLYAGAAPHYVSGFAQVNVAVPADLPSGGNLPLTIQVGDVTSQAEITVAVSAPITPAPMITVFLIHGLGESKGDMQGLYGSLTGSSGIDLTRFKVDAGFDFSECADGGFFCSSSCSIEGGAQKLAQYIASVNPPGDIVLLGFSLGGVLARDMMANKRLNLSGGKVAALITLGGPNLGYPYAGVDILGFCPNIVQELDGNWRSQQATNDVVLSSYLDALTGQWATAAYPGSGGVWLAAAGRSCSNAVRTTNPSTGCPDRNPFSDGLVCAVSATYGKDTPAGTAPSRLWQDPEQIYVHTNSLSGLGSGVVLCANSGNPATSPPLSNPPSFGLLFAEIRSVINGL
jgi:uncharacterized protein (TIGR03437 family)